MITSVRLFTAILMLLLIGIQGSFADENGPGHGESKKPHAIGVFIGATHAEEEYLETLGVEYGYFISESVEVGAVVERAVRQDDSTLVILFVSYRPYKGWLVGAGIGRKDPGPDRENTLRLSVGYDFEVSHIWSVEAQLHLDMIEEQENEEVLGVAIVRRF